MRERKILWGSDGAESDDGGVKTNMTTAMLTGPVVLAN